MYLNKVIVIGNLTRDPELRALPSGGSVTSFSVATNRTYKDKNGERKEDTDFHNIVVFGKTAESCAKFLKKGQSVMVEGRSQTRSWDKDGQKMYRTEVIAENVQFGPKVVTAEREPKQESSTIEYPEEVKAIGPDGEEIPF